MKYIIALPRDMGAGKPSELRIIDTVYPFLIHREFSLPEESSGKTVSPYGLYVPIKNVNGTYTPEGIFVSVKDGVIVYDEKGNLKERYNAPPTLETVNPSAVGAMAHVDGTLYWSLTNFPLDQKQHGLGLFRTNGASELERILHGSAPVGPLVPLDDGIIFYLDDDPVHKEGRFFCYNSRSLTVSRKRDDQRKDILYPQPVGICVDANSVYTLGKQKDAGRETVSLTLFDHTLEEQGKYPLALSGSVCTAFALWNGNYDPPAIETTGFDLTFMEQKQQCTYGIIGLEKGNIALFKARYNNSIPEIDFIAEFDILGKNPKRAVQNVFAVQKPGRGVKDAELVVVYDSFAISFTSYELLARAAFQAAIGRPSEVIAVQFPNQNKRIQSFGRNIFASAFMGV
ncbi:hypothetical protein HZC31_05855 [Candidatus Woesearchaeota archaeon]|nr:hypothetical protein [Candidatus Woesearchaeota archaeon]